MSLAEEAEAVVAAYAASARGTAAAGRGAKKGYRKAQELGMRFQNWQHGGDEDEPEDEPGTGPETAPEAYKGTTEEYENMTSYYSHTTYKRPRP